MKPLNFESLSLRGSCTLNSRSSINPPSSHLYNQFPHNYYARDATVSISQRTTTLSAIITIFTASDEKPCNYGKCRLPYVVGGTFTIIVCYIMNVYCRRCDVCMYIYTYVCVLMANRTSKTVITSMQFWILHVVLDICHCWKTGHICDLFSSTTEKYSHRAGCSIDLQNLPEAASLCYCCVLFILRCTTAKL